jgi:single-strand DNA-binding protein
MFHTIIAAGNLGQDPEMRFTNNGQPVTNFPLACNRQYTNAAGESVKETIWLRISVWGKQAEACNQYLRKGSKVLVEGRLNPDPVTGAPRVWESNGRHGASYEIVASRVLFMSPKEAEASVDVPEEAMVL